MSYCSFLYIWIHLILLRLVDVPKFRAMIPREIWIELNIHTSFKTETSEAIIDCYLVVILVHI